MANANTLHIVKLLYFVNIVIRAGDKDETGRERERRGDKDKSHLNPPLGDRLETVTICT